MLVSGSNLKSYEWQAGQYPARCRGIFDLGTKLEPGYQGAPASKKHKLAMFFEFIGLEHVFDESQGPEPVTLSAIFTASLSEQAKLRAFLQTWRGKPFTAEEIKEFDLRKLLGAPCLANVQLKPRSDGSTRAEIDPAMPFGGGELAACKLPHFCFTFQKPDAAQWAMAPEWAHRWAAESDEYGAVGNSLNLPAEPKREQPAHHAPGGDLVMDPTTGQVHDDEVPF